MNHNTGFQLGFPTIHLEGNNQSNDQIAMQVWDYAVRIIAGIVLICFLPILAVVWVAFKCTDPGPMFFKQSRPGYNGELFTIYKIRTMRLNSENETALGTSNDSPQVTPIGRILRALKLDEAPQLLNIVRGDMVIVGPRPIPQALDTELRQNIPGFGFRYSVKPGLTSIGQICVNDNALGDALIKDWTLRFEGELHYIRNRSIRYDFILIGMTALFVFKKLLNR